MAINNRVFYAIQAVGFAPNGRAPTQSGFTHIPSGFTVAHGVQSIGIDTNFNLEPVFELGQLELYENIEGIPEVEVTAQKVLDGYPLLYHLATPSAASSSLVGRSNARSFVALNIYPDTFDNASGLPIQVVGMSGMFVSSLTYTLNVEGNSTEDVTLVGNNKVWLASGYVTFRPNFNGTDAPLSLASSGGVQRREDVLMGQSANSSRWPTAIPGITSSGTNPLQAGGDALSAHIQTVTISADLGREELFELGLRAPYHRFVTFPVEVTCGIEITTTEGDLVQALADPPTGTNLVDETIIVRMREGTVLNLGTKNKLASITYGGGDATGGNATVTYNYSNNNSLTVTHPQDPAGL